jgi:hypothetical protein
MAHPTTVLVFIRGVLVWILSIGPEEKSIISLYLGVLVLVFGMVRVDCIIYTPSARSCPLPPAFLDQRSMTGVFFILDGINH